MENTGRISGFRNRRPRLFQFLVTAAIVLLGIVIVVVMMATRKEVSRQQVRMPVPSVTTLTARPGPMAVVVSGEGTVRPLRQIDIAAQVPGRITMMSPYLLEGGAFSAGDTLLRIEPVDFELAVRSARAKVKDLESKLQMMIEESEAALQEWRIAGNSEGTPPPLVAKEPQLEAARAALQGGIADLEKAELNLERTCVTAPFDGIISTKSVDIGQFVPAGMTLCSIFSTEAAEIAVALTSDDIEFISIPGFTSDTSAGSAATVHAHIAGVMTEWPARVMRAEGVIDERTRMIKVVVRVDDPYAVRPPLAMGLFTTVDMTGMTLEKALLIPRSAVKDGRNVWIVDGENRLRLREVEIARFEGDNALVSAGIEDGEAVVTSQMKVVAEGMEVVIRNGKARGK
ncbi:MAG TPA: efflux RND transporter periplasmic adaptor subunit [Candidatus Krumholzibacterium sp.]|nr:efflux RND transporter periplasmic adaptor subunit [Candidatus Krumholzibacterium sp.]